MPQSPQIHDAANAGDLAEVQRLLDIKGGFFSSKVDVNEREEVLVRVSSVTPNTIQGKK